MKMLSRSTIASGAIDAPYDAALGPRPIRILQIGDGVFLRGFVDWTGWASDIDVCARRPCPTRVS